MSTWFDERVRCPHCGHEQTARLAHGVHVARAPEVREQILARTFHAITCAACLRGSVAERPLIYTDVDRKHWIQVALADERPRWPELEVATRTLFARAFIGSPLARELEARFRVRLVFGLEELREKLVVWNASLDDAVVECLKVEAIAAAPVRSRARIAVVDEVLAGGDLMVRFDDERVRVAASAVKRASADARLPGRFPELFGGTFVAIHRLLGPRYRWAAPGA
jgi:hypothetical protein